MGRGQKNAKKQKEAKRNLKIEKEFAKQEKQLVENAKLQEAQREANSKADPNAVESIQSVGSSAYNSPESRNVDSPQSKAGTSKQGENIAFAFNEQKMKLDSCSLCCSECRAVLGLGERPKGNTFNWLLVDICIDNKTTVERKRT